MKIEGAIVIYNPDKSIIKHIKSYLQYIDKLYIIDNSEQKNETIQNEIGKFKKAVYIDNNGNHGIAHALNKGAKLAIQNGAQWLLTMDQDSFFKYDNAKKLFECISKIDTSTTGIISPYHDIHTITRSNESPIIKEVDTVMTSGNLVNLDAFQAVGGFLEKLFIDNVDNEYCLRLKKNGYKIFQLNNSVLEHSLGEIKKVKIFKKDIYCTNHSPTRRYYIARNSLYIWNKYCKDFPNYCKESKKRNIINIVKIIIFEKEKFLKIYYILLGIKDFYLNKFGMIKNREEKI